MPPRQPPAPLKGRTKCLLNVPAHTPQSQQVRTLLVLTVWLWICLCLAISDNYAQFDFKQRSARQQFLECHFAIMKWIQAKQAVKYVEAVQRLLDHRINFEDWVLNDQQMRDYWWGIMESKWPTYADILVGPYSGWLRKLPQLKLQESFVAGE